MNLIEAMFVLGSIVGGMVAATLVGEPVLFVLAIPMGMLAGGVLSLGALLALGFLAQTYEEYQTDLTLRGHFGAFQSKNADWLWEDVDQNVRVGQIVRGQVATRLDGDVYVDVGLGFPARLRPWGATDREGFDLLRRGHPLEARVVALDPERRIIELTQR